MSELDDLAIVAAIAAGVYLITKIPSITKTVDTAITPLGLGSPASTQITAAQRSDAVSSIIPSDVKPNSTTLFFPEGDTTYRVSTADVSTMTAFQKMLYGLGTPIKDIAKESGLLNLINPAVTLTTLYDTIKVKL
jgi:hypothetical protein